jgi:hypothetical protein
LFEVIGGDEGADGESEEVVGGLNVAHRQARPIRVQDETENSSRDWLHVLGRHGGFHDVCEGENIGLLAYFFQITLVFDQPSPVLWPLHN